MLLLILFSYTDFTEDTDKEILKSLSVKISVIRVLRVQKGLTICRVQHGTHDSVIPRAPTQIPCQPFADFVFAGVWILVEQGFARDNEAWRAVSTLQGGVFDEFLL